MTDAKRQIRDIHSGGPEGCVDLCNSLDYGSISYDPRKVTCSDCLSNDHFAMWAAQSFDHEPWVEIIQALGAMGESSWRRRADLADAIVLRLRTARLLKEHWHD